MEITGNLAFIAGGLAASGPLAGDGNFLSLTLSCDDWSEYDKVLVGLDPSEGTGLVRIDNDTSEPAHTVVMKITDNTEQVFVVESYRGSLMVREEFSLAELVCATS